MQVDRRHFIRLAAGGSMAGLLGLTAGAKTGAGTRLGTSFTPRPKQEDLDMLRHAGVECVSIWTGIEDAKYEWMAETRRRLEANSVEVYNIGILDLHCDPTLVLGLDGVEKKIEQYKDYLRNLGRAGIHYTTYAHMANIKNQPVPGFYQTSRAEARGGAPTREFDVEVARKLPLSFGRTYTEDHIWKTFSTFIRAVMPVAEKAKVRIGLHPDDPPVDALGGVPRIFRNAEGYERAVEVADSENFGYCFCVGTWAEGGQGMGRDVLQMIRRWGPKRRIFKVHFRNVSAPLPKFHETFVDDGYLDMYQVMRALREVNFDGIVIPDHVPGGGYPAANISYTLGYMKALRDRVNAEFRG